MALSPLELANENVTNWPNGTEAPDGLQLEFDPRLRLYFFVCSLVSVCFAMAVILIYACKPRWRRHPDELLLNRTVLDAILMLCHVLSYALKLTPSVDVDPKSDNGACVWISVVYQFAVSGSTLWYFIISLDLLLIIRNPFRPNNGLRHIYYPIVYLISIGSAVALLLTHSYGLTALDFCWISMGHTDSGFRRQAYVYPFVLYFGWSAVLSVMSVAIVVYAAMTLRRALAGSDAIRRRLLLQLFAYVVVLSLEWTLRAVLWVLQSAYVHSHYQDASPVHYLGLPFALVEGSRGLVDFVAWATNGKRCRRLLAACCCVCGDRTSAVGCSVQSEDAPLLSPGSMPRRPNRLSSSSSASWAGSYDNDDGGGVGSSRHLPSQSGSDARVGCILRHDLICCIAWGIVDMAPMDWQRRGQGSSARQRAASTSSTASDRPPVIRRKLTCPRALRHLDVDFVDYAPTLFTELRLMDGVSPPEYAKSFQKVTSQQGAAAAVMDEVSSTGSSGSFFYFTGDKRYLVKTLQRSELAVMLDLLPRYHTYMGEYRDSFLPRFCGLHETRLSPEQAFVPIVVMQNICATPPPVAIHEKYDLKGSWVNRTVRRRHKRRSRRHGASKKDAESFVAAAAVPTWKDCDLERCFHVGADNRRRILDQLRRDTQFLVGFGLMDYSLLVAVHNLTESPETIQRELDRRQQRARLSSVVAAPQLPVDLSLHGGGNSAANSRAPAGSALQDTGAFGGRRVSLHTDSMLASYERPPRSSLGASSISAAAGKDSNLLAREKKIDGADDSTQSLDSSGVSQIIHTDQVGLPAAPFHRAFAGGMLTQAIQPRNGSGENGLYVQRSICYVGLIDIFQKYTLGKRAERFYKVNVRRSDGDGVSVTNVQRYAERFMRKMEAVFV